MRPPDAKLLAIFQAEQQEHVERLRQLLAAPGPAAAPLVDEALRRAHTLKGASRAVGIEGIERLAHGIESVFVLVRDGGLGMDVAAAAVLPALDAAEDVLAAVLEKRAEPAVSGTLASLERLLQNPGAPAPARPEPAPQAAAQAAPPAPEEYIRVGASSVDELVRSSSELLRAAGAGAEVWRRLSELAARVSEIEQECLRLRHSLVQRRQTAGLAESLGAVLTRARSVSNGFRRELLAGQRGAWTLERLSLEVYRDACRVRMIPAGAVFEPFRRMVRDLASAAAKEVEFRMEGLEVHADRLVLQKLKDAVMHLLRNAVAHGIEAPHERERLGKSRSGLIRLRLETNGDRLNVTVEDDGAGVDAARVARIALEKGLIDEAAARSQSPPEIVRLLLQPGFSTAGGVTRVSGRGMGLSAVHEQVLRLHGEVAFSQEPQAGTSVSISVPLSISGFHVLLFASCGQRFAVPAAAVDGLRRIRAADIETLGGRPVIRHGGHPVRFARLPELFGWPGAPPPDGAALPVIILRGGGRLAALGVDELLDERAEVIKELGLPYHAAGMATGAVPLGDGSVAVVLSAAALIANVEENRAVPAPTPERPEPRKRAASILVVDDSITTRSLEKSILEAHGFRVRLAVDGADALTQLRSEPPDLVIADVSMPRMDGFELLERMKQIKAFASIPVIMVTSLERHEDRQRGLSLGADAYIIKRKFDQRELLEAVRQVL